MKSEKESYPVPNGDLKQKLSRLLPVIFVVAIAFFAGMFIVDLYWSRSDRILTYSQQEDAVTRLNDLANNGVEAKTCFPKIKDSAKNWEAFMKVFNDKKFLPVRQRISEKNFHVRKHIHPSTLDLEFEISRGYWASVSFRINREGEVVGLLLFDRGYLTRQVGASWW